MKTAHLHLFKMVPSLAEHTCNSKIWEAEGSGEDSQSELDSKVKASMNHESYLKKKKGGEGR